MDREEILYWKGKYETEEDLYTKGDEEELKEKFRKNKYLDKEDLIRIVKWKFQGRLTGRQQRLLRLIGPLESSFIQDISSLAFKTKDDEIRLKLLMIVKGVGVALASVILAFYDPQQYGVLDIHAWRGLFGEEPKDLFTNMKHALFFFDKLRDISARVNLPCRDIEKAIFKRDIDKG